MLTTIGIIIGCCALWAYVLSATGQRSPSVRRLEEAVIAQQEQLLHLTLYAQWLEETTLDLADDMHMMQETLADDYPDLIDPPQPNYPPAYDKWGEFDA